MGLRILLGMPKGYNRVRRGTIPDGNSTPIMIVEPEEADYGPFDVAVWSMQDGPNVLVRVFQPRVNTGWIYIHPDARREAVTPDAVDSALLDMD